MGQGSKGFSGMNCYRIECPSYLNRITCDANNPVGGKKKLNTPGKKVVARPNSIFSSKQIDYDRDAKTTAEEVKIRPRSNRIKTSGNLIISPSRVKI